jgi:hypothetical protein
MKLDTDFEDELQAALLDEAAREALLERARANTPHRQALDEPESDDGEGVSA